VDALLIDAWLDGAAALPTIDEASVSVARETVRRVGEGLDRTLVERVALAASELVQNQLRHARRGQFAARRVARGGVPGLEIIAADAGNGIADPARALAGPGPSATSLGAGLAGARRMTQEMDIDVRVGEGTCVRARAFAAEVPRRREIGVVGRALAYEPCCGDHAAFARTDDALVLAVVDGVGHGPAAREAADLAVGVFHAHAAEAPVDVLAACDAALLSTRGAVMGVARIHEPPGAPGQIDHAAVGNIMTRIERYRSARILGGTPATLGARGVRRKPFAETVALEPGEVVLMYTDGLKSRVNLSEEPTLLHEHPVVIAQRVIEQFARPNDDALVLVAR
jgi:anti-sigma regulatory factor (Ser/Thr protein kinase)